MTLAGPRGDVHHHAWKITDFTFSAQRRIGATPKIAALNDARHDSGAKKRVILYRNLKELLGLAIKKHILDQHEKPSRGQTH